MHETKRYVTFVATPTEVTYIISQIDGGKYCLYVWHWVTLSWRDFTLKGLWNIELVFTEK